MTRLRSLAERSNFPNLPEAAKDQFTCSCASEKPEQKLLREKEINLEKCTEIARNSEVAKNPSGRDDKSIVRKRRQSTNECN